MQVNTLTDSQRFMLRCLELASRARGDVAPNPLVGAVLVHQGRIIGEGWHKRYGQAHAEVNCLDSVRPEDRVYIPVSTMYVSLEPCSHFGKTPPCADLLIRERVKKVVIGMVDPFNEVNGQGVEKLREAGVEVDLTELEDLCKWQNRRFLTYHRHKRPYVILKWAESADGRIAAGDFSPVSISNSYTNVLVHRWRSEEASILVGTRTALFDDPRLNTRLWTGNSPTRLVVDLDLRLPSGLRLFDGSQRTIVFNALRHEETEQLSWYQVTRDVSLVVQILNALFHLGIQSVIVEGGARLLQAFMEENAWDEIRQIRSSAVNIPGGLPAPVLPAHRVWREEWISGDHIRYLLPPGSDIPRLQPSYLS